MRVVAGNTLEAAVADAIGADVIELQDVIAADLDYDGFLAHRDLRRISGIAVTPAGRLPWSLIEKTTGGPATASAYLVDNGRRELAAYRSGLLAELPAGVRAPALHGVDDGVRLIHAPPRIAALLDSLPQTLCHHDAVGATILRSDGVTVLVDWQSVGRGTVGADSASLLFSSARRGDCSAELIVRSFDTAVTAYTEGVRETGANIDPASVRLGVDAAITLRWKLLADIAVALARGTSVRRGSAPQGTPATALDELVMLSGILEAAADRLEHV